MKNTCIVQNYRGFDIERFGDGWIVQLYGDEIYCDTLEIAEKEVDEYLD